MRFFRRPLLDVVGRGSAHRAQDLSTSASLEPPKVAPTRAPAPMDYSRAKSAAVGAVVGAALSGATIVGGAIAKAVDQTANLRDRAIAEKMTRKHLSYEQAAKEFDKMGAVYLRNVAAHAAKKAVGTAVAAAIGGGAAGFMYASDQNANNLATKRGEAPMGGGKRFAKAAAAYTAAAYAAGSLIDRAARAKFGTLDADLEHRKPRGAVGVRRPFV